MNMEDMLMLKIDRVAIDRYINRLIYTYIDINI